MKKIILCLCLELTLASSAFALQNYYCPTNAGTIQLGMSMEQVKGFCGSPTTKNKQETYIKEQVPAVQLYYRVGGNVVTPLNLATANPQSGRKSTSLTVTYINNKVSNISLGGSSVPSASVCSRPIKEGDSMATVNSACGSPYLTNHTQSAVGNPKKITISTWFYQFNPYQSITLTFQEGILKSISK